jgi:ribosomal protein L32
MRGCQQRECTFNDRARELTVENAEVRACSRCGEPVGDHRFCPSCGVNLGERPEDPGLTAETKEQRSVLARLLFGRSKRQVASASIVMFIVCGVVVVAVAISGGGKTTASTFRSPPLQQLTSSDSAYVRQDLESYLKAPVAACSFVSSDPVTVSASAALYGAADVGGLLDNPSQMSAGEVLEFLCVTQSAPQTGWALFYTNAAAGAEIIARGHLLVSTANAQATESTNTTTTPPVTFSVDAGADPQTTAQEIGAHIQQTFISSGLFSAVQVPCAAPAQTVGEYSCQVAMITVSGHPSVLTLAFTVDANGNVTQVAGTASDSGQPAGGASGQTTTAQSSPPSSSTSASTATTTQLPGTQDCGTLDDPQTHGRAQVSVQAGSTASCLTVRAVVSDFFAGRGILHQGQDQADTYMQVHGWNCGRGTPRSCGSS